MQKYLYPNNRIKSNKALNIVKLFAIFVTLFISSNVLAQDTDPIGDRLCFMIAMLQYNVTRIISIIAIMGLGVLALRGKLSWIISLMIIVGIIIIYKAPAIASMIYGDLSQYCTSEDWSGYGNSDVIGSALCKVLKLFRGSIMRAIAIVGIMVLGIQALKGILSWPITLMSIVGIILMLSAPDIYISMVGKNDYYYNCYGRGDKP